MPTVDETVATAMRQYPTVFPSRAYCLAFWLLQGQSTMQWYKGELVDTMLQSDEVVEERRRKRAEAEAAREAEFEAEHAARRARVAAGEEAEDPWVVNLMAKLKSRTPEQAEAERVAWAAHQAQHARADVGEARVWRALCQTSDSGAAFRMPRNVTDDWRAAIREVLVLAIEGEGTAWVAEEYPTMQDSTVNDPAKKAAKTARFQEKCRALLADLDRREKRRRRATRA